MLNQRNNSKEGGRQGEDGWICSLPYILRRDRTNCTDKYMISCKRYHISQMCIFKCTFSAYETYLIENTVPMHMIFKIISNLHFNIFYIYS